MERTVWRTVVIQRVFPARWILTWLVFAVLYVLAEVDCFFRGNIKTDSFSHVFEGYAPVLVFVQPIKNTSDLFFWSNKSPELDKLLEATKVNKIICWESPLVKDTLQSRVLAESFLDQLLLEVVLSHHGRYSLLIRLNFGNRPLQVYFKLRVFLWVVSEEKCFCWLNAAS